MKKLLLCLFGVFIALLFLAQTAHAATFVVNTLDDGNDVSPGDGICEVNVGDNDCGLRALIEETNALGGADIGNFDIPGAGVHTFTPGSAYPVIVDQLTINGETQGNPTYPTISPGGAQCGTLVPTSLPATSNTPHTLLIEIDGSGVPSGSEGLKFFNAGASNSVVRALVINRFDNGRGINIDDGPSLPDNVTAECNYLGTNPAGTSSLPNGIGLYIANATNTKALNNLISGNTYLGVDTYITPGITFSNNLVGTTANGTSQLGNGSLGLQINDAGNDSVNTSLVHNIFAGNTGTGARMSSGYNWTATGNFFGLNLKGEALGNGGFGFEAYGSSNFTIGGTLSSERNYSSANGQGGIRIYRNCSSYGSTNNGVVYNNYIGTNTSGQVQSGFGNQGAGVEVNEYYGGCASVFRIMLGGDAAGQANIIAGNSGQGLLIHQQANQDVYSITSIGNSIYNNAQFGIDLAADEGNDNGDADTDLGPNPLNSLFINYPTTVANYYLNHPVINTASFSGNQLTVDYSYQANAVQDNFPSLLTSNLVGYRLDFYLNDAGQDGAYTGYSQGKIHVGSFIVNGSETNATHTFTSPVTPVNGQTVTATATVLWQLIGVCDGTQQGEGPPYGYCGPT